MLSLLLHKKELLKYFLYLKCTFIVLLSTEKQYSTCAALNPPIGTKIDGNTEHFAHALRIIGLYLILKIQFLLLLIQSDQITEIGPVVCIWS